MVTYRVGSSAVTHEVMLPCHGCPARHHCVGHVITVSNGVSEAIHNQEVITSYPFIQLKQKKNRINPRQSVFKKKINITQMVILGLNMFKGTYLPRIHHVHLKRLNRL